MVVAEVIPFSSTHKGWNVKNTGSTSIVCHVPKLDNTTRKFQVTVIIGNSNQQQLSPGDEFTVPAGAQATITVSQDDIGEWEGTNFIAHEDILDVALNPSVLVNPYSDDDGAIFFNRFSLADDDNELHPSVTTTHTIAITTIATATASPHFSPSGLTTPMVPVSSLFHHSLSPPPSIPSSTPPSTPPIPSLDCNSVSIEWLNNAIKIIDEQVLEAEKKALSLKTALEGFVQANDQDGITYTNKRIQDLQERINSFVQSRNVYLQALEHRRIEQEKREHEAKEAKEKEEREAKLAREKEEREAKLAREKKEREARLEHIKELKERIAKHETEIERIQSEAAKEDSVDECIYEYCVKYTELCKKYEELNLSFLNMFIERCTEQAAQRPRIRGTMAHVETLRGEIASDREILAEELQGVGETPPSLICNS